MDVDCRPGLVDDVVFGDGDEDFLTYCAATSPAPEPVAPEPPAPEPAVPEPVAPQPVRPEATVAVEDVTVEADGVDPENGAVAAEPADAEPAATDTDTVEAVEADTVGPEVEPEAGPESWSWEGFLLAYGVTWSGDEELWGPFRHWFAHHATAQGFEAEATTFLRAMDRQPDRVLAFARYGIPVARPVDAPRQGTPARCPYDLAAWTGYLDGRGATWDGGAASWPGFRAAFLAGADGLGLTVPATAFVEYVDSQPDRATVFRRYGLLPAAPVRVPSPHPRTRPADDEVLLAQDIPADAGSVPAATGTPTRTAAVARTAAAAAAATQASVPAPRNGKRAAAKKPAVRNVSGTVKPPRARSSSRRTAA